MEPDFVDDPEFPVIFKPISIQRMECKKVGDPIDCQNTDCLKCVYDGCDIKKRTIQRNEMMRKKHEMDETKTE